MPLSTRTLYGLRALLDLAGSHPGPPVQLRDIAARQGLAESYLEQLMVELRRAGLIQAVRGRGGGFRLARAPEAISLLQVIDAVDGELRLADCPEARECCGRPDFCAIREVWDTATRQLRDRLADKTLATIIARERVLREGHQSMYWI